MAITYKNTKVRKPKKKKRISDPKFEDTYYNEEGKPTKDPAEIEKIRRKIKLSMGGVTIDGKKYTYEEAEQIKRKRETEPIKEAIEARKAAPAQLEEAGAFEEVTPEEVELMPPREGVEKLPVIGPGSGAALGIWETLNYKEYLPVMTDTKFPVPLTPETIREEALRKIRNDALKKGISEAEAFGAMVEAIPLLGGQLSKYAGDLIESPSENAKFVIDQINKLKEAASTGQEKVRNGLEDPEYGLTRARQMEEQIAELEGRLKLLIITSASLRANQDEVNKIQEQILEAKEKVARYKKASSFGLTAQLTGTGRIIPTDEQLYLELKAQAEGK